MRASVWQCEGPTCKGLTFTRGAVGPVSCSVCKVQPVRLLGIAQMQFEVVGVLDGESLNSLLGQ